MAKKIVIGSKVIASTDTWQKEGEIIEAKKIKSGEPGRGQDLSEFYEIKIKLSDGTLIDGRSVTWFPM